MKNIIRSKQLFFVLLVHFLNISSSIGQAVNTNDKTDFSLHEVKLKETIYSVSNMFDISADELIELNPELKDKGIQLGMTLKVPAKKEVVYNENQIISKLDNLKEVNFEPFPIFLEAIKKSESEMSSNKARHWNGELFIKEGLIFVPRCSNGGRNWEKDGFSVYDLNRMQYGTIGYYDGINPSKLGFSNILRPNFDDSSFFTFRNSKVYKTSCTIEDYSEFEYYNYPRYNPNKWDKWDYYSPDVFSKFSEIHTNIEIKKDDKIYTYQIAENTITGDQSYFFCINKNGNYAMCSKAVEMQNHNSYAYIQ